MLEMPRKLPPHLYRERTRHGVPVWYVRVGKGKRVRIRGEFGSSEFETAYAAAVKGETPAKTSRFPADGTFAWGAALYRRSQVWASLKPSTRQVRGNILKRLEEKVGHTRLRDWTRKDVIAGRDARADRPAAARHFVDVLRGMFRFLLEADLVKADPTDGVKVARPQTGGHEAWTDADLERYRAHWKLGTRQRVALELLYATGLRRGDAVRAGEQHVRNGVIRLKTEKTGETVAIAVSPELLEALRAGPTGDLAWIVGETGLPLTKESFGNNFRDWCNAAGVSRSAHGVRKAAATGDAHDGWSDAELDAKYGWRGRRMAPLYTREAQRERLSLEAARRTKERTKRPAPG